MSEANKNIDVSVVINHYKDPLMLKTALKYVHKWKKDFENKGGKAEIIVTDSATIRETQEMMNDLFYEDTYLTEPKNVGFGRCVNRALKTAKGNFIFMMNADLILPRAAEFNKMLSFLEENKDIGIIGPRLLNFDETHQPSAFRYYTLGLILRRRTFLGRTKKAKQQLDEFMLRHEPGLLEKPTEVDWLMGSALLTKKEYLDKTGLFDERFFMYMEDVDLCRRFWQKGMKVVYCPEAKMYHFHGAASRDKNVLKALFNKYTRIHLISAFKYFRKHGLRTPRNGV